MGFVSITFMRDYAIAVYEKFAGINFPTTRIDRNKRQFSIDYEAGKYRTAFFSIPIQTVHSAQNFDPVALLFQLTLKL